MAPLEFWRGMLAFHLMGVVEFEPGPEEPDFSAEIAALLELNQRLLSAAPGDPAALGLPPRASREAVERAAAGLQSRFAPERFGPAAAPEVIKIAREVCRQLRIMAQGSELPGEAEWRRAAPESPAAAPAGPSRSAAPEPPRQAAAWPFLSEAEEVPPAQDEEEFELSAEFAIDEPPGAAPEIVLDERDRLERTPVPGAEAPAAPRIFFEEAVPPVHAATEQPVEWIVDPDVSGVPEPEPPEPAPPPFAPVAAPPALHMVDADHERAWELLLQAKSLYEKHDCAGAVPLLKKAIRLEPKQGDFYYLLGLCQSEAALTKNEAEISLKKAIELKSWSADPVYALGVLYRGQGKMKLAERCFTRVKEIAYEHTGASRALVDLRRQKVGRPPLPPTRKKH
jgi:tetratricopeptide (TPR) repeat protein